MGLIKAVTGAVGGALADQWKEYFYCDAMDADVLAVKGQFKSTKRSSNKHGDSNVITNGSAIMVADGQCMIIVEQGKVVELAAEPGVYTYDSEISPTIFDGDLFADRLQKENFTKDNFKKVLQDMATESWTRFKTGGDAARDQRVYYFNTKEIPGNKYGTATPIPFRVVDRNIGLDVDISIRCNGEYSYKIVNPMLFFTNVCGNVESEYRREEIDSMLKSELMTALQPAFAKISDMGVRYSALPAHTLELADALNEVLSKKWSDLRGISVISFGVNSVSASEEDEAMIKNLQKSAVFRDPTMAAANLAGAQADAMRTAAGNENGAMMGFMGMGMANQAGGMNAQALYGMGQQPQQQAQPAQQPAAEGWKCSCGAVATGKFCQECGSPKPAPVEGWQCTCGAVNRGKFCPECGSQKPAGAPLYQCDKCGWQPEDPHNPPKFCPECGDVFDENDVK